MNLQPDKCATTEEPISYASGKPRGAKAKQVYYLRILPVSNVHNVIYSYTWVTKVFGHRNFLGFPGFSSEQDSKKIGENHS